MEERKEGVKGCGSEMLACVPGKYRRAGVGANASGAGAYKRVAVGGAYGVPVSERMRAGAGVCCNRLSETLSVMQLSLPC